MISTYFNSEFPLTSNPNNYSSLWLRDKENDDYLESNRLK